MKLLTLVLLTITAISTQAQQWVDYPAKKVNKVCIVTTDSPLVALKKVAQTLLLNGYTIANKDADLLMLNTEFKGYKAVSTTLKIHITTGDSTCIWISGQYKQSVIMGYYAYGIGTQSNFLIDIDNRGLNNSDARNAWNEMDKVVESINGKKWYWCPVKPKAVVNYND